MEQFLEQSEAETQQRSTLSTPKRKKGSQREQEAETLRTQKMEVIAALMRGSSVVDATQRAGVDRTTYYLWTKSDPEFLAELNRAKLEQAHALRTQIQELVPEAIQSVRELLTGTAVPPGVRLKTAMLILQSACTLKPDSIGATDPEEILQQQKQAEDPLFRYL